MITCTQCNHINSPSERFCTRCGKPLASPSAQTPPTQLTPMARGAQGGNKGKTQVMPSSSPAHIPQPRTEIVGTKQPAPAARASGGNKGKTQIFNPNKVNAPAPAPTAVANNMISNTGESPLVGFLVCRDFNGDTNGVFWPLRLGRTYIGRDPNAAEIVLPFDNISGAHAVVIFRANGKNWISDNDSQNGTFVDGEDIGPDKYTLETGSQIQIGDVYLDVILYNSNIAQN